jgi:hypothetical protein
MEKSFKSSNARLQNIPEIIGSHWIQESWSAESRACRSAQINSVRRTTTTTAAQPQRRNKPRTTELRKSKQWRIHPIQGPHNRDDPASTEVEERAEKHIQTRKSGHDIASSYHGISQLVRSNSRV